MKKMMIVLILIVMAGAGCSARKADKASSATQIVPPTSITTSDPNEAAHCAVLNIKITAGWNKMFELMRQAAEDKAKKSFIKKTVAAGRAYIEATHSWVSGCGTFFPAKAAEYNNRIAEMEPALDELEKVANSKK